MLAEAAGHLIVGQAELLDQPPQAPRLFDRIEVCALKIFDEAEDELFVVACAGADDCRHGV